MKDYLVFYFENVTCMSDDVCGTFFIQILLFTAVLEQIAVAWQQCHCKLM